MNKSPHRGRTASDQRPGRTRDRRDACSDPRAPAGRRAQPGEGATLVLTEMIFGDQVQGGPGFGFVVVVPIRAVPATAIGDLSRA
jgi:hypothetical protein